MTEEVQKWSRSESRVLSPYRKSRHSLDGTRFSPIANGAPLTDQETFFLAREDLRRKLTPKLKIELDTEQLLADTDCREQDLRLSLVVRDLKMKNYVRLDSWLVDEYPTEFAIGMDKLVKLSPTTGLDFLLVVTLANPMERAFGQPHYKGSILASRQFAVRPEADEPQFPVKFVAPEEFSKRRLPQETLWHVEFLQEEDFDQEVDAVLEVWVNENAKANMVKMGDRNTAGNLFMASLSTEIYLTICQKVFSSDFGDPQNSDGLLYQLLQKMENDGGLSKREMQSASRGGELTKLRAHIQKAFSLTQDISAADLRTRYRQ